MSSHDELLRHVFRRRGEETLRDVPSEQVVEERPAQSERLERYVARLLRDGQSQRGEAVAARVPQELRDVWVFEPPNRAEQQGKKDGAACCKRHGTPHVWSRAVEWSHVELVDIAVDIAVKQKYQSKLKTQDVLSLGIFKGANSSTPLSPNSGKRSSGAKRVNPAVRFLKSPAWGLLHQQVGDELLQHLLLHTVMLCQMNRAGTHVQICGPMVAKEIWKAGTDLLQAGVSAAAPKPAERLELSAALFSMNFTRKCLGLPKSHALQNPAASGRSLAKEIFGTPAGLGRAPRLWATTLLRNHKRCPYGTLLNRTCPIETTSPPPGVGSMELRSTEKQVSAFLKTVCLRVLPRSTLNGRKARRRFLEAVSAFVRLGRHDYVPLDAVAAQTQLPVAVARWVFQDLLVPLLRTCFYCTERSGSNAEIHFFRKPTWVALCRREIDVMCYRGILDDKPKRVSSTRAATSAAATKLRFVPKLTGGLRPIMNCKRVNFKLAYVHQALKAALFDERNPFATAHRTQMVGLNEFYAQYRAFVLRAKASSREGAAPGRPPFHMLTLDVKKCFDHIDHDILVEKLDQVLQRDSYIVQGYHQVFVNKAVQRARSSTHRYVLSPGQADQSGEVSAALGDDIFERARASTKRCIFVDRVDAVKIRREEVLRKVRNHIRSNTCAFGNLVFHQARGIPQGSVLSVLLCTLYFQAFEHEHVDPVMFSDLAQDKGPAVDAFCTRLLDDYLVISRDPAKLDALVENVVNKSNSYKVRLQPDKTKRSSEARPSVSWCGYTFSAHNLSVTFDRSRLSLDRQDATRQTLYTPFASQLRQALQTVALRAKGLLFDADINPLHVQVDNAKVVLCLARAKIHPDHHAAAFCDLAQFLFRLAKSRTNGNTNLTRRLTLTLATGVFL